MIDKINNKKMKSWKKYGIEDPKSVGNKKAGNYGLKTVGNTSSVEKSPKLRPMKVTKSGCPFLFEPNVADKFCKIIKESHPEYRISTSKEGEKIRVLVSIKTKSRWDFKQVISLIPMVFNTIQSRLSSVKGMVVRMINNVKLLKSSIMKSLFSFFKRVVKNDKRGSDEIKIESGMPLTIKKIKYSDVLKMYEALLMLEVNQSFEVKREWSTAVRKLTNDHFDNYKITIRKITEDSYRVYRIA